MPFIEAFRQFQFKIGLQNFCNIHVSLVPQVIIWGRRAKRVVSFDRGRRVTTDLGPSFSAAECDGRAEDQAHTAQRQASPGIWTHARHCTLLARGPFWVAHSIHSHPWLTTQALRIPISWCNSMQCVCRNMLICCGRI